MEEARKEARSAILLAQNRMKTRWSGKPVNLKIGDKVWLEGTNLRIPYPSKKLAPKRYGPFVIMAKIGRHSYKLKLPKQWRRIHPVFHASLLMKFRENETHGKSHTLPPPDEIEGEEEWEVEKIMSHKGNGKTARYLIRWKGYAAADDTWEPLSNINNAKEELEKYKEEIARKQTTSSSAQLKKTSSLGTRTSTLSAIQTLLNQLSQQTQQTPNNPLPKPTIISNVFQHHIPFQPHQRPPRSNHHHGSIGGELRSSRTDRSWRQRQ